MLEDSREASAEKVCNKHPVLYLAGAAQMLHASIQTVRVKAKAGLLPGRKVGKHWIFSVAALDRYLAGEWEPQSTKSVTKENEICPSTRELQATIGITSSFLPVAESSYRAALERATKPRRRSFTTG